MLSGLGAFVRGGMDGYRFGEGIDDRESARERQKKLDAMAEEDRARSHRFQDQDREWLSQDRDYTRSERDRVAADRDWLQDLFTDAGTITDEAMAGGGLGAVRTSQPATAPASAQLPEPGVDPDFDAQFVEIVGERLKEGTDPNGEPLKPQTKETLITELAARASTKNVAPTDQTKARPEQGDLGAIRPKITSPLQAPPPVETRRMGPTGQDLGPTPGQDPDFDARLIEGARAALASNKEPDGSPLSPQRRQGIQKLLQQYEGQDSGVGVRQSPPQQQEAPLPARSQGDPRKPGTFDPQADAELMAPNAPPTPAPAPQMGTRSQDQTRVAEQAADSWVDQYVKTGVPHVVEQLLRRGMVEQAEQFQTWGDSQKTRQGMQDYGRAAFGASVGDFDMFSEAVISLYNNEQYYDDGLKMDKAGSGFTKDENGNVIGATITFVDEEGDKFTRQYESLDGLVEEALSMLHPEKAFEAHLARIEGATTARVDAAKAEKDFADWMRKEIIKDEMSADDETVVMDVIKELSEDITSGFNKPGTTNEERLAMVAERVKLIEDAQAAASQRPASAGNGPTIKPPAAPPAQPEIIDNVMRRP